MALEGRLLTFIVLLRGLTDIAGWAGVIMGITGCVKFYKLKSWICIDLNTNVSFGGKCPAHLLVYEDLSLTLVSIILLAFTFGWIGRQIKDQHSVDENPRHTITRTETGKYFVAGVLVIGASIIFVKAFSKLTSYMVDKFQDKSLSEEHLEIVDKLWNAYAWKLRSSILTIIFGALLLVTGIVNEVIVCRIRRQRRSDQARRSETYGDIPLEPIIPNSSFFYENFEDVSMYENSPNTNTSANNMQPEREEISIEIIPTKTETEERRVPQMGDEFRNYYQEVTPSIYPPIYQPPEYPINNPPPPPQPAGFIPNANPPPGFIF